MDGRRAHVATTMKDYAHNFALLDFGQFQLGESLSRIDVVLTKS
jgi:hypothetical protein